MPVEGGTRSVVLEGAATPVWSPTGHLLFGAREAPCGPCRSTRRRRRARVTPCRSSRKASWARCARAASASRSRRNGTLVFVPADLDSKRLRLRRPRRVGAAARAAAGQLREPADLARRAPGRASSRDGTRRRVDRPRPRHARRRRPSGRRNALPDLDERRRAARAPALQRALLGRRRRERPGGRRAAGRREHLAGLARPRRRLVHRHPPAARDGGDVYLMSVTGAFPPKPLRRDARPTTAAPSSRPTGAWLVYQSSASGQPETYVRRYPELDRAWPVSEGGGVQCRWSPTGREIYYRGGGKLVAVAFDGPGSEPVLGKPARCSTTCTTSARASRSPTTTSPPTAVSSCCAAATRAPRCASCSTGPRS